MREFFFFNNPFIFRPTLLYIRDIRTHKLTIKFHCQMKTFAKQIEHFLIGKAVNGSTLKANIMFARYDMRLSLKFILNFSNIKKLCIITLLLIFGVGSMRGATPELADFDMGSPTIINENFNSLATVSRTATVANTTAQTAFGVFNYLYNNNTSNTYAIANAVGTTGFSTNCLSLTAGSGSPLIAYVGGKTFGTVGVWRLKTTKTSYNHFGIYANKTNTSITHADARIYVQNNKGVIKIHNGSSFANDVGTFTTDIIDICVIYNKSGSAKTYGDGIALANNTAHVYINGVCIMNGASPKSFSLPTSALTGAFFRVNPQATSGNKSYVDDVQVWNALPTAKVAVPYSVTLKDDNTILSESVAEEGVDLPVRPGCVGYTFAGWSTSNCGDSWITSPAPTIISAGEYHPKDNMNLYPVYTKNNGFSSYAQIAMGDPITNGKYIISTGSYTMAGSGKTGTSFSPSTTEKTSYEYTIAVAGDYFTIKGPDDKYVGGANSTSLTFNASVTNDTYRWKYVSTGIQNKTNNTRHIKAYGTTDFRHYASSNGVLTYLYKRTESLSYISVPGCATCVSTPTITFSPKTATKELGTGTLTKTPSTATGIGPGQTLKYSSSNPLIATVNESTGEVTPVNSGIVTITAYVEEDGDYCEASDSYTLTISSSEYTVSWSANGSSWSSGVNAGNTTVSSGGKILSMPTPPSISDCYDTKEFVGWTRTPIVGSTNTEPADLFTTVAGSPTINSNTTFYAVFAKRADSDMPRSVTSYSAGDYYLIDTYDGHYYALTGGLDESVVQSVDVTDYVTESAGTITLDVHGITPQMRYTLSGAQSAAKLVNTLSGDYIACNASSPSFSSSSTNTWNITKHGSRNAFSFVGGTSGTDRCILYRNNYDFRNYETSNRNGSGYGTGYLYLVATRDDATFSGYATTCVENKQVSWVVGGEPWTAGVNSGNTSVEPGSKIATMPTAPTSSDCDGLKYFMGWTNEEHYSNANFAPTLLFTNVAGSPTITEDITFYAVFADVAEDVYQKVTSTAGITDGDYLIVYETGKVAFNGGLTTLDATNNTIAVTITSSKIPANATTNAARFVINKAAKTIKSASGYYIGRTTDSNGFNSSTSTAYTNTMSISSNNFVVTSSGGPLLRYNSSSDQKRFRYYATGQQAIQLYKKTVPNYTTVCALRTITWHVNDGTTTAGGPTTEVSDGGYITKLPTTPNGAEVCGGKTFIGWTTAPYTNNTTPPAILYNSASEIPAITADMDFYAVFAEGVAGDGDGHYYKVTEDLDDWTGKYLIVYETDKVAFNGALTDLDVASNTIPVTITAGKIEGNMTTDAASFTISGDDVAVSIKSASGKYIYRNTASNGLDQAVSIKTNTLTIVSNNAVITGKSGYVLRYNKTAGQLRFRYFNGTQQAIQLYRKNGTGTTYSKFSTTCGPRIMIGEPELLTSTRGESVLSAEITVEGSYLSGSTLSANITGTNAAMFSCTLAATSISEGSISTTYHITYTPSAYAALHTATLRIGDGTTNSEPITLRGRSLPAQFAIVAEVDGNYYALNGNLGGTAQRPVGIPVTVSAGTIPSCPQSAVFSLYQREPVSRYVYLTGQGGKLWGSSTDTKLNTKTGNATSQTGWLLQTEDFNTYHITNSQTDRGVMYRTEEDVFGHYADGNFNVLGYNGELFLMPIGAICTSLEAPKVTIAPKATSAILTWTAIDGATSYVVTCSAGSVTVEGTTATITGLANNTQYTYTVKAVAAGTDCSLITSGTFYTSDCDDVPVLGDVVTTVTSAVIKWTCEAATSTIRLYNDESCTILAKTVTDQTSPATITELLSQHTYWYKISAGGTCVSNVGTFQTLEPSMDIVEWNPASVTIDYSGSDDDLRVIIDKEVTVGDASNLANELFFSKYFEASSNNKFLAIFNGTASEIDLTKYKIGMITGVTAGVSTIVYYPLDTVGRTKRGKIMPHEEIVFVTYDNTYSAKPCAQEIVSDYNKWYEFPVGTTFMQFSGPQSIGLYKYDDEDEEWHLIDVIGSSTAADGTGTLIKIAGNSSTPCASAMNATLNDAGGFYAPNGDNIRTEATETNYRLSTNRCLLIRKSTVKSGANAVANNVYATTNECSAAIATSFTTLASEWAGYQISNESAQIGRDSTCKALGYIGAFDYANFYHTFENIHDADLFSAYAKDNGTHVVPVAQLDTLSCTNIKVQLINGSNENVMTKYYQVPIMISSPNTLTTNATFRSYARDAEVCKTCKVVVLRGASLVKATDGSANDVAQIGSLEIYQSGGVNIPVGTNYNIKDLRLRAVNDNKDSLPHITVKGTLNIADDVIYLDRQLDDKTYYWVSFPFDVDMSDVTYYDGTEAIQGKNFFLKDYNGVQRAIDINTAGRYLLSTYWQMVKEGTIQAGRGYNLGIPDEPNHKHRRMLSFPLYITSDLATLETTDKDIPAVDAAVSDANRQYDAGWNCIGNPYLQKYTAADDDALLEGKWQKKIADDGIWHGAWEIIDGTTTIPYITTYVNWDYTQSVITGQVLQPFTSFFVQVKEPNTTALVFDNDQQVTWFSAPARKRNLQKSSRLYAGVVLTNDNMTQSDKTSLLIGDEYSSNTYQIGADLQKMKGNNSILLYSIGKDNELAFQSLTAEKASQNIALGYRTLKAGEYTFMLNDDYNISPIAHLYLYDSQEKIETDLLYSDYTFYSPRTTSNTRFSLRVELRQFMPTDAPNCLPDNMSIINDNGEIIVSGLPDNSAIYIYDMSGKLIYQHHCQRNNIVRHKVPQKGVYNIRIISSEGNYTAKTIVK